MKHLILLFSPVIILFFAGCAHTNELAKYDLTGRKMFFSNSVSNEASTIQFVDNTSPSNDKNKDSKDLASTLASIGSDILSGTSQARISNAVNTASMADYVSQGLKTALVSFFNVKDVNSADKGPQFIVETTVERCELVTGDKNVSIKIKASSRIIDQSSGNIVWDDNETSTIPLQDNYSNNSKNGKTANKVLSAVQLASLSDRDIQKVVDDAAINAGRKIGETLREDVVKLKNK